MYFRALLALMLFGLIGCANQVSEQDLSETSISSGSRETIKDHIILMSQFQGTGAWQKYTSFRIFRAPDTTVLFETANGELLLTVTAHGDKDVHFLIPGVVYMNKGLTAKCAYSIDLLERMGLIGQMYLHTIEEAFPGGPQSIQTSSTKKITGDSDKVLHFLAGSMIRKAPWMAEVTISPESEYQWDITIDLVSDPNVQPVKSSKTYVVWSNQPRGKVLADSTSIDGWEMNWLQLRTWGKEGPESSSPVIGETESYRSVGDIRQITSFQKGAQ